MLLTLCLAVASYRPSIPVTNVKSSLGIETEQELVDWLTEKNITLTADNSKIDCKTSMAALPAM